MTSQRFFPFSGTSLTLLLSLSIMEARRPYKSSLILKVLFFTMLTAIFLVFTFVALTKVQFEGIIGFGSLAILAFMLLIYTADV